MRSAVFLLSSLPLSLWWSLWWSLGGSWQDSEGAGGCAPSGRSRLADRGRRGLPGGGGAGPGGGERRRREGGSVWRGALRVQKTKKERRQIPWEELIYEDRETLGPRKLKSFIFPWKDQEN